uniref:Uncharacterized protein n=1 Tax=Lutzomyia longipalpis TaxID=7200 RepID=A0A1B0CHQ5_LUTLO
MDMLKNELNNTEGSAECYPPSDTSSSAPGSPVATIAEVAELPRGGNMTRRFHVNYRALGMSEESCSTSSSTKADRNVNFPRRGVPEVISLASAGSRRGSRFFQRPRSMSAWSDISRGSMRFDERVNILIMCRHTQSYLALNEGYNGMSSNLCDVEDARVVDRTLSLSGKDTKCIQYVDDPVYELHIGLPSDSSTLTHRHVMVPQERPTLK